MQDKSFPILVLDGGGSKGVYTLGVLEELEKKIGKPLHTHFKLIYGTSTGSIIAALLGLGKSVQEIKTLYFSHIPSIMSARTMSLKSKKLKELCDTVFGNLKFDSFKTDVGIVALNYTEQKPLIFKTNMQQSYKSGAAINAGFGCFISDAVQASCSAYPVFNKKPITSAVHGNIIAVDGGYIARNATLYALIDADKLFGVNQQDMEVFSLGTGHYVEKPLGGIMSAIRYFDFLQFIVNIISSTSNTNEQLQHLLFEDVKITRIDNTYHDRTFSTNMIEKDLIVLGKLFNLGKTSFSTHESKLNLIPDTINLQMETAVAC